MANKIDEEINKSVNKIDRGIDEVRESKYLGLVFNLLLSGGAGLITLVMLASLNSIINIGIKEGVILGWFFGPVIAITTFLYLKRKAK